MAGRNKGKGGPITKLKKAEIMTKLKTLVQSSSIDESKYESLASDLNTTRQTISKYVEEVYSKIPPAQIQRVLIDFKFTFDRLETEVNKALEEANTVKERLDVIRTYFQFIKEKTEYMERFFIKDKATDKIQLEADITTRSLQVQIIDDRRDAIANGTTNGDYQ